MAKPTLGLDLGGANIKAAHTDGTAWCVSFALWKHPERLSEELARLCASMPTFDRLAVTMTGELCDCFETKREGVLAILQSVTDFAGATPVCIWTNQGRFLDIQDARNVPLTVAAANWLALCHLVGQQFPDGNTLLIDTGSTTTDIVYLRHGEPDPRGRTDPDRLDFGELVYTGVRRTPVCSVLGLSVAAEFFATMLDAYVVTGLLPEEPRNHDTADGRPATCKGAHARLARMRCADCETLSLPQAKMLAERALRIQWDAVRNAIDLVLKGRPSVQRVVLAGSGEVLGQQVAARHSQLAKAETISLAKLLSPNLSAAACAHAVANLATQERFHA